MDYDYSAPLELTTRGYKPERSRNINPHYIDPILGSKHMGESREIRIKEFHKFNDQIVIGLREGSYLQSQENNIILKGPNTARIFKKNNDPLEIEPEFNLNKLLN